VVEVVQSEKGRSETCPTTVAQASDLRVTSVTGCYATTHQMVWGLVYQKSVNQLQVVLFYFNSFIINMLR
jgi:hypothetical protein